MKIKKFFNSIIFLFHNPVIYAEYKDKIMTVKYKSGKIEKYEGRSTVWYSLPSMSRPGTLAESWLSGLYKYNKRWGGPYPNAHKEANN